MKEMLRVKEYWVLLSLWKEFCESSSSWEDNLQNRRNVIVYGFNNSLLNSSIYNVYRRLERWTTTCSNRKPSTLCSHFQFRLNIAYSITMLLALAARTSYGWGFMQTKRPMKFSCMDNLHESHIWRTLRNIYCSNGTEIDCKQPSQAKHDWVYDSMCISTLVPELPDALYNSIPATFVLPARQLTIKGHKLIDDYSGVIGSCLGVEHFHHVI